jgi:hypothetical protein
MVMACVLGASCALLPAHGPTGHLAAGEPQPTREEPPGVWRTASRDGANCLYLFLALAGRKVDYQDVKAALEGGGRGSSLADLQDAARRLGLDASVYQWWPSQLIHAPSPVIAYMDNDKGEGGYFMLVLQATDRRCYVINGANATIEEQGADDFRHAWSGFVLAPTQPAPSPKVELLSYGISGIILAGYGWFRVRRALAVPVSCARSQVA